jgi:hypothetical protein
LDLTPLPTILGSRYRQLAFLLVLVAPAILLAQDVTEVTLKSAFIYNFVRFTEWPTEVLPAGGTISACVVGDPAVGTGLARTVKGRQLDGRAIAVSIVPAEGPLPACHLLYVSGLPDARVAEIVTTLRAAPVLTISDIADFAKKGGVVQLFLEAGKMRFSVNLRAAKRMRLQLSSRLLTVAAVVEEASSK